MPPKTKSPETAKAEVDAYFARLPEPARAKLEELRAILRTAVPKDATEALSYSIPAFHSHGPLLSYAAFKHHISFFPMGPAQLKNSPKNSSHSESPRAPSTFLWISPFPLGSSRKWPARV